MIVVIDEMGSAPWSDESETVTIRSKTCPFSGCRVRNGHDSDLNVPAFDEVCKKGHVSVFSSQLNL